jgi:hypothetical protein
MLLCNKTKSLDKEIRNNAALTLSLAAENSDQKIPQEVLDSIIDQIADESFDVRINIANLLGYYAKKDIEAINKIPSVWSKITDSLKRYTDSAINVSFALESMAENIKSLQGSISELEIVLLEESYHIDAKHNTSLAIAHLINKGCTLDKRTIERLSQLLLYSKN